MAFRKRRDGIFLKRLPAFRRIFPYLMPTRTESLIYFGHTVDMTGAVAYLSRVNGRERGRNRITLFHLFLCATARTLLLRPELNRFVAGRRIYQHREISLTFIVKKVFTEEADESNARIVFTGAETPAEVRDLLRPKLETARSAAKGADDKLIDTVAALPRPLSNLIARLIRFLDYHNILPRFLMEAIPLYTSVYLANLGSIGLGAPFHHLYEFGSASLFLVIGKLHKKPVVDTRGRVVPRDCLDISVTLDERITEGFYAARSIALFAALLEQPELLEKPKLTLEEILAENRDDPVRQGRKTGSTHPAAEKRSRSRRSGASRVTRR